MRGNVLRYFRQCLIAVSAAYPMSCVDSVCAQSGSYDPFEVSTQLVEFNFAGNGGVGLLPGNEVGPGTASAATSNAVGAEVGGGLVFDKVSKLLKIDFEFEDLTGGLLTAAAWGIHLHLPDEAGDPFNESGGIVFNLNNFDPDDDVTNFNQPIADGATSGSVFAIVSFENQMDLVDDLLAGELYLNIHSQGFNGGELRGSLTAVPEPATLALLSCAGISGLLCRRRRSSGNAH